LWYPTVQRRNQFVQYPDGGRMVHEPSSIVLW
jgi:hypothetical protein